MKKTELLARIVALEAQVAMLQARLDSQPVVPITPLVPPPTVVPWPQFLPVTCKAVLAN